MQELCRHGTLALQGHGQGGMHRGPQVTQFPRFALWVGTVKVREESGVRQVPEARSIVGHGVRGSRDVVRLVEVSVVALMQGL